MRQPFMPLLIHNLFQSHHDCNIYTWDQGDLCGGSTHTEEKTSTWPQ